MNLPTREPDYHHNDTRIWYEELVAHTRVVQGGEILVLPVLFSVRSKEIGIHISQDVSDSIPSIFGPSANEVLEFSDRIQNHYNKWLVEKALAEACIGKH